VRIYTPAGDIPYRLFNFPDGQPHIELQATPEYDRVTIEARIGTAEELLIVLLARDVLQAMGKATWLDIRYLMGGRMDRRINTNNSATLNVIARTIAAAGFQRVRVLDPHSLATLRLVGGQEVLPYSALRTVFSHYGPETWILAPDTGSTERVQKMLKVAPYNYGVLQGSKARRSTDGTLSNFEIPVVPPELKGSNVLILDDICDGGRTFVGMAEVLHHLGVIDVDLFVTHGIFSGLLPLNGIRKIWTTDSYRSIIHNNLLPSVTFIPVRMQDEA
jgi:ribose-phosphate pyrophosphokinase